MSRSSNPKSSAGDAKGKCPMCGGARLPDYRPFCSKRCADLDLAHWFTGQYRVPAEEAPDEWDRHNVVEFPPRGRDGDEEGG